MQPRNDLQEKPFRLLWKSRTCSLAGTHPDLNGRKFSCRTNILGVNGSSELPHSKYLAKLNGYFAAARWQELVPVASQELQCPAPSKSR